MIQLAKQWRFLYSKYCCNVLKKHILFVALLVSKVSFIYGQQHKSDSLFNELKKWQNKKGYQAETLLYNINYSLGVEYKISNTDTAIYYFKQSLFFADQINDLIKKAKSLHALGKCYILKDDDEKALQQYNKAINLLSLATDKNNVVNNYTLKADIYASIAYLYDNRVDNDNTFKYYFKALKLYQALRNKEGESSVLGSIGVVYDDIGNYAKAMEYYFKALEISEEINNKEQISLNLCNIGGIYLESGYHTIALDYHFKSLKISREIKDKKLEANVLGNIGIVYKNQADSAAKAGNQALAQKNSNQAFDFYFKALEINQEINDISGQAVNLGNIGNKYFEQGDFKKAEEYYSRALQLSKAASDKRVHIYHLCDLGTLYCKQKKYKQSEEYLIKAIQMAEEMQLIFNLEELYNSLSDVYLGTKRYEQALQAYKKHIIYRDSLAREENQKSILAREMQYNFEKKQIEEKAKHQREITEREAKTKQQRLYLYLALLLITAVLFVLFIVIKSLKTTKRQKIIIEQARDEIFIQKKIVDEKNKDILDSIKYAKRIQQAILPNMLKWNKILPDSFVMYLPKDIVAGDFYWMEETTQYIYLAAADCTGHGVPGAMVSVVCSNALTKTVMEDKLTETNKILDSVRKIVIEKLSGTQDSIRDGMDICLIRIDKQNRKRIQYSGANRPLWLVRNKQLIEYKSNKQSISFDETMKLFTSEEIILQDKDVIYLCTDGYSDQFGSHKHKKLGTKKFKELLTAESHKDMQTTAEALITYFNEWKLNYEQVDDVTVIGIKF